MLDLEMEDRNGVKFIREIMPVGVAGGGYVEYYWDNPAVEGDEVTGSRKIGYAEGFRLREGGQVFIVGSGIYAPDR